MTRLLDPSYWRVDGSSTSAIRAEAQEEGIREVTFHDDGSVAYNMSRTQHREIMAELRDEVSEGLVDLTNDFVSIQQVEHDRGFTRITLTVDRDGWEDSFDGFAILAIGFAVSFYQIFDGTDPDDIRIDVDVVDAGTGEVFDTMRLSDDWDD